MLKIDFSPVDEGSLYNPAGSMFKVISERHDQLFIHGRTVEKDVEINSSGQILEASMRLLSIILQEEKEIKNLPQYLKQPPQGWDINIWNHILGKSDEDKMIVAASFLMAEYDRRMYIKNKENEQK